MIKLIRSVIITLALLFPAQVLAQNPVTVQQFGASVDTNSGNKSANTQRVVIATDQPSNSNAWLVSGTVAVSNSFLLDATLTGRLPAGSTPANGESNAITTSRLGTYNFIFNGATWDRWTGLVTLASNQTVNVAQLAGTTTDTNSGTKSAGTLRVVIATDQPALTNKLLVTPDSVALPANQSVNVAQLAGTTTDTNSGTKSAGTLRVVLATDQPALTNKLLVTPDSVALPANQSVNVAQMNGVATTMGAGATGTGVQRVNDVASSATGAAPPASAIYTAGLCSGATGGFLCGVSVGDSNKVVNVSTATTTLMVTGVSGRQVHITSFHLLTNAANSVAWIEGTGATCGTGSAGMAGGTTAASGYNLAANGGIAMAGYGDVLATSTTGDSVCIVTSAATQLSGFFKYAIY